MAHVLPLPAQQLLKWNLRPEASGKNGTNYLATLSTLSHLVLGSTPTEKPGHLSLLSHLIDWHKTLP